MAWRGADWRRRNAQCPSRRSIPGHHADWRGPFESATPRRGGGSNEPADGHNRGGSSRVSQAESNCRDGAHRGEYGDPQLSFARPRTRADRSIRGCVHLREWDVEGHPFRPFEPGFKSALNETPTKARRLPQARLDPLSGRRGILASGRHREVVENDLSDADEDRRLSYERHQQTLDRGRKRNSRRFRFVPGSPQCQRELAASAGVESHASAIARPVSVRRLEFGDLAVALRAFAWIEPIVSDDRVHRSHALAGVASRARRQSAMPLDIRNRTVRPSDGRKINPAEVSSGVPTTRRVAIVRSPAASPAAPAARIHPGFLTSAPPASSMAQPMKSAPMPWAPLEIGAKAAQPLLASATFCAFNCRKAGTPIQRVSGTRLWPATPTRPR